MNAVLFPRPRPRPPSIRPQFAAAHARIQGVRQRHINAGCVRIRTSAPDAAKNTAESTARTSRYWCNLENPPFMHRRTQTSSASRERRLPPLCRSRVAHPRRAPFLRYVAMGRHDERLSARVLRLARHSFLQRHCTSTWFACTRAQGCAVRLRMYRAASSLNFARSSPPLVRAPCLLLASSAPCCAALHALCCAVPHCAAACRTAGHGTVLCCILTLRGGRGSRILYLCGMVSAIHC